MREDIFKKRDRAFEAVYFAKLDAELIERLHQNRKESRDRRDLAKATGISNEGLLDRILELGVRSSSLEALSLAPLICMAWADGSLTQDQHTAALKAAMAEEIGKDTPSFLFFEAMLSHGPDPKLMEIWRSYIASLLKHLDARASELIRSSLLDRAEEIAKASGGIMGVGSISRNERQVLDEIESAMN